jgi:hypothetical protein
MLLEQFLSDDELLDVAVLPQILGKVWELEMHARHDLPVRRALRRRIEREQAVEKPSSTGWPQSFSAMRCQYGRSCPSSRITRE